MVAKKEISWPAVLLYIHINLMGFVGLALLLQAKLLTIFFCGVLVFLGVIGVTVGAHRLWAHRAYEASLSLRIFLMFCHTLAGQGTIYDWVIRHRAHHKYVDTDQDLYQIHKGFWQAHVIANIQRESKIDKQLIAEVDAQDLENDAVVSFQKKFYWLLMPIVCILLPINAPMEYWGDSMMYAFCVTGLLRYALTCHLAWLVHSAVHIWGLKPGDKFPADTMLVFILTKSHWLKYHYILPWDYQVGEYSDYGDGCLTSIIRVFAAFGWATNLRTVSTETIKDAIYTSTISGKSVGECVQDITVTTDKKSNSQEHFHSTKFL